jgi:hypothetical protein
MKKQFIFSIIALALILGGSAWFAYRFVADRPRPAAALAPTAPPPPPSNPTSVTNFKREGNLSGDAGQWKLTYDEPGKSALVVNLEFTAGSRCGEPLASCENFAKEQGMRVVTDGIKNGDTLYVATLRRL